MHGTDQKEDAKALKITQEYKLLSNSQTCLCVAHKYLETQQTLSSKCWVKEDIKREF